MGQLSSSSSSRRAPGGKPATALGTGRRIYDLLRMQIADGTLPPGACLPSTRGLAAELGVFRTTVTAADEQLAAEGYIVTASWRAKAWRPGA